MTLRQDWDAYFMDIARTVATRSTCLRVPDGVGCVLVRDHQILATGYCGSIRGMPHCTDPGVGCLIDAITGGCQRTVHAEQNAVGQAARNGARTEGATVYATLSPCLACFKLLVNAGVETIVYLVEYRVLEPQRTWARERGIVLRGLERVI